MVDLILQIQETQMIQVTLVIHQDLEIQTVAQDLEAEMVAGEQSQRQK
jgi:hypothetical protein